MYAPSPAASADPSGAASPGVLLLTSPADEAAVVELLGALGIAPRRIAGADLPGGPGPAPLAVLISEAGDPPEAVLGRIRGVHDRPGWPNVVAVLILARGAPVPEGLRSYDGGPVDVLPLPSPPAHLATRLRLYGALAEASGARAGGPDGDLIPALEQAPEGVVLLDERGRVLYANPAFAALTGVVDADLSTLRAAGFPGIPLWSLLDEAPGGWEGDVVVAGTQEATDRPELAGTLTRLEGALAGGRALLVLRDVSRVRQLERQLADAQRMEAVGQLAGGVAHDFNNVLSVITTLSELLMRLKARDDPDREDLQEIYESAVRGSELTRQLLAFSRAETGDAQRVDLNDLLRGTQKMLRRLLPEDLALELDLDATLPPVWGDPVHLDQMLLNLAVNAREVMPWGGTITFRTRTERRDEAFHVGDAHLAPGSYAVLEVADDGPGLPEEVRARVFEPFFTTRGRANASGLGLSVVYGRVRGVGGGITVDSAEGRGTTFRIHLPAAVEESGYAGDEEWPGGDELILLVEDQPNLRKGLRRFLSELGYDVMDAGDGREAWSLLQAGVMAPSLIVSDVVMPEMSGLDLAESLDRLGIDAPVILMSGYADHPEVERAQRAGIGILPKPVDLAQLARRIRATIDSHEALPAGTPAGVAAPQALHRRGER